MGSQHKDTAMANNQNIPNFDLNFSQFKTLTEKEKSEILSKKMPKKLMMPQDYG